MANSGQEVPTSWGAVDKEDTPVTLPVSAGTFYSDEQDPLATGAGQGWSESAEWQCMDPTHLPSCSTCTPPPEEWEQASYELVGDPGKKNGEKILRHLAQRRPEWKDPDHRSALAKQIKDDDPRLAAILETKNAPALRKHHLFSLSRYWGLKSNLWRPKRIRRQTATVVPAKGISEKDISKTWAHDWRPLLQSCTTKLLMLDVEDEDIVRKAVTEVSDEIFVELATIANSHISFFGSMTNEVWCMMTFLVPFVVPFYFFRV